MKRFWIIFSISFLVIGVGDVFFSYRQKNCNTGQPINVNGELIFFEDIGGGPPRCMQGYKMGYPPFSEKTHRVPNQYYWNFQGANFFLNLAWVSFAAFLAAIAISGLNRGHKRHDSHLSEKSLGR